MSRMIGKLVLGLLGVAVIPRFRDERVHDSTNEEQAYFAAAQRVSRRSIESSSALLDRHDDETTRIERAQSDIRSTLDTLAKRLERHH